MPNIKETTKQETKKTAISKALNLAKMSKHSGDRDLQNTIIFDNITPYVINCDWVQFHVNNKQSLESDYSAKFTFERTGQTKVFRSIYTIKNRSTGEIAGTYATDANECIMKKNHGVFKIENRHLYLNSDLEGFCRDLLNELDFKFIGITRLDICMDFQYFLNKRLPENFVRGFVSNDILKLHSTTCKTTFEQKQYQCKETGCKAGYIKEFDWISFGKNSSVVSYKLYNKTKEQERETRKPYLFDVWEKFGKFQENTDIWRLEFTLNSTTAKFFSNNNATFAFHDLQCLRYIHLVGLFIDCYKTNFEFVKHERTKKRIDRMKRLHLFEFHPAHLLIRLEKIQGNEGKKDSTRSTKIFLSALDKHQKELREFDTDFEETSKQMISKLIDLYGLQEWAKKKYIEFEKGNYSGHISEFRKLINQN